MNAMLVGKYPKQNNQPNCHWWLLPWQRRHRKVQGQKTTTFDRKGIEKAQQFLTKSHTITHLEE